MAGLVEMVMVLRAVSRRVTAAAGAAVALTGPIGGALLWLVS